MNFPEDLFYTKDHEWIQFENDTALIGITDFAQKELGDIVFVDVPSITKTVNKEEVFGTVEAVKTVSDLFMPVSGTIIAFNTSIEKSPELINQAPYESWIIKIKLNDLTEKDHLLTAEQYKKMVH
jgi:glycine cleavage system H protein